MNLQISGLSSSPTSVATVGGSFPSQPAMTPQSRPRVLVVDDDSDNLELVCFIVEQAGYQPLAAMTGQDAITVVQHTSVNLVLLDILLPDQDGFTVLANLRAGVLPLSVPIVAVTAMASTAEQQMITAAGFSTYLCKPFSIESLESLLQQYCPMLAA